MALIIGLLIGTFLTFPSSFGYEVKPIVEKVDNTLEEE